MKKRIRFITCVLIIFAFVLPLLIQPAFVRANEGRVEGNIVITPSYNSSNGRLSVKGQIVDRSNNGANIRVTIKIIDPSNKLLYIGEEESNAHGEFAFVGPITYEEGIYSIYVGSEITEQGVVNSFKLKKETPTDPTPDPDPKPDLDPSPGTGTTPGTGQISKEQIKEKIENIGNMLENIDEGSIDKEKAVKLLEDIIVQAGRLKADDKNSIKKDLEMIAEKVIIGVSIFDINKLAEDNKNIVISEEDNLKRIEIADSIINEAIQSMEKTYERVKNTLDKNDYNEISSAISKNKAIRFINYADINLSFALTVNSMDVLSEKGIDLVINNVNAKGVSFVIPSEALDSEYIAKYLKKLANTEKDNQSKNDESNDMEKIKAKKVNIVINRVEEDDPKKAEYDQAAKGKQKGNLVFSVASEVYDLSVMLTDDADNANAADADNANNSNNTDNADNTNNTNNSKDNDDSAINDMNPIYLEKFNKKLAIEISLDEETIEDISGNKINKDKLGVYRYNPKTKDWDYAGGKFDPETGRITFKTDHLSIYAIFEYNKTFKDIEKNWAKEYIEVLASKHIVSGVNEENFEPGRNVRRAEFTKMLLEALDLVDKTAETTFIDVAENSWYYKYAATAQKLGIVTGVNMNRYKPEEILTREDMAVLAYKAIKAAGVQLPEVKEYKEFDDNSQISDYAKEAVKAMQLAGILEGTGKNMFLPKNNSARAEAAKIIYMIIE